jgi:hypothetical protein
MISIKKKGVALITCYLIILILSILGTAFLARSVNDKRVAERKKASIQAFYLAEGALEDAIYQFTNALANFQSPPVSGNIPEMSASYTNSAQGGPYILVETGSIPVLCQDYLITATATHPEYTTITSTANQFFRRKLTSAFNYAVFYADDLELIPGPNMTLSGRVHSNSDIYIAAVNTLTIDAEYLYSAGNIYNKRKDDGSREGGDVRIRVKDSAPAAYANMEVGGVYLDSDNANWTVDSQTRWNETVKSSVHGVTPLAIPAIGSIQPDGYYADNADLKITKKAAGTWEIYSGGGQIDILDLPANTIKEETFRDNREGKDVTVTEIDMSILNTSGYFPANSLLYVTREDATVAQPNGVRLINGESIQNGLTVASNNPIYLQGDYNKDDPGNGFIKKPAALICDAINILSNSWNDANSDQNVNNRVASNTEINTAVISGIVPTPTGGGNYSGGLENYPRLHERWTGKTLAIRGSFVELWESQIAQGQWQYGNPQYTAPIRDWDYDTDFNDVSKLPPFSVYAVSVERLAWW